MAARYYKRPWNESRGDDFDRWGPATYYLEVGDDDWPSRQVEIYENGPTLRYDLARPEDYFRGLAQTRLDEPEGWARWSIPASEFEEIWNRQEEYAAMTVNERLLAASLLDEFDGAIIGGRREVAIDVLRQARLDEAQAAATVDSVLANPQKYGFPRPT